ncbi:hypothetical protein BB8028_0002g00370 [Beauveria bassiana]|uniref:Uncharacterized protein n=1 Tax=Beauveria bassiana TaxID=176275 RepID=A0A2S7Y1B3_BEABA|nr:hypothetical protein BB8028_0002g00370 [Beauveria bassiana]
MVRIAVSVVLAFAISAMALSGDGVAARAAALRVRDDVEAPYAEARPADTPEDVKNWMATIAEAAGQLQKMAQAAAEGDGQRSAQGGEAWAASRNPFVFSGAPA